MRVRLVSGSHFAAAHRLHREDWDEATNRRVFDKCNNPNGHGHTYGLEVTVEGEIDPETGYLMDFGDLKRAVEEDVVRAARPPASEFRRGLSSGVNPTAENIAVAIWKQLEPRVGAGPARPRHAARDGAQQRRLRRRKSHERRPAAPPADPLEPAQDDRGRLRRPRRVLRARPDGRAGRLRADLDHLGGVSRDSRLHHPDVRDAAAPIRASRAHDARPGSSSPTTTASSRRESSGWPPRSPRSARSSRSRRTRSGAPPAIR